MRHLRVGHLLVPRAALLGLVVLCAGVEIVGLVNQWDVMRSWASVVEAANGAWLVLGILVVGTAAAVSAQTWSHRELTSALPDAGGRTTAAAALTIGFVAAGVHALTVTGLVIWGWAAQLPGQPRLWPVLSVLAGLMACALFGTAVARLGAGALSPLVAMGLYVALLFVIRALGGADLVDLGGVSVVLVGLAPDTKVMLLRAAWLASAAAVAWWFAAHGRTALRRVPLMALVVLTTGLAVVTAEAAEAEFVQTRVQWVCEPGPPRVCVAAEYDDRLHEYAVALRQLAPSANRVGLPTPPRGYRQTVGARPGPGSFNVDARVRTDQLTFDLVQFSLPCSLHWSEQQLQRADVVAGWLASQAGGAARPVGPTPTLEAAQRALDTLRCDR